MSEWLESRHSCVAAVLRGSRPRSYENLLCSLPFTCEVDIWVAWISPLLRGSRPPRQPSSLVRKPLVITTFRVRDWYQSSLNPATPAWQPSSLVQKPLVLTTFRVRGWCWVCKQTEQNQQAEAENARHSTPSYSLWTGIRTLWALLEQRLPIHLVNISAHSKIASECLNVFRYQGWSIRRGAQGDQWRKQSFSTLVRPRAFWA